MQNKNVTEVYTKEMFLLNQNFQSYFNPITDGRACRFENSDLLDCYNFGDFTWVDDNTDTGYLVDSDTNNDMYGLAYKATMSTLIIIDMDGITKGTYEAPAMLKQYMAEHKKI